MKKLLPIAIIVILIAVGAFFGGMKYSQNKTPKGLNGEDFQQRMQQGANVGGLNGGSRGNGFTSGEIISKDDTTITIKLSNGSSIIILYSDTTEISKFVDGADSDLQTGTSITVSGTKNDDGSTTAQSIQIRPEIAPIQ